MQYTNLKIVYLAEIYNIPPEDINHKNLNLYTKKEYSANGLPTYTEYYKEFDGVTYTDLYIREDYTYMESSGLYVSIVADTSYYDFSDSVAYTYQKTTNLNIEDSFQVGVDRREYVLKKAMREVYFSVGEANAIILLDPIALQIFKYRINVKEPLKTDITASANPLWLTPSVSDPLVTLKVKVVEILNV